MDKMCIRDRSETGLAMFVVCLDACGVVRKGYGQTVAADGHGVKRDVYGRCV